MVAGTSGHLVGREPVATHHIAIGFGDEAARRRRGPHCLRLVLGQVSRIGIGLARGEHLAEDRPDHLEFRGGDFADCDVVHQTPLASAIATRPRRELLIASVMTTSTNWPTRREWPAKLTERIFSV